MVVTDHLGSHCIARRVPAKHIPREQLSSRGREPVASLKPWASGYLLAVGQWPAWGSAGPVSASAAPWDHSAAVRDPYSVDRRRRTRPRRPLAWRTCPTDWASSYPAPARN